MKNTKKLLTPMFLVLIGLATLSFMAKEAIMLRLHPEAGKSYTVTSKANMTNIMKVQGQTMTMSQVVETKQSFTAKNVTDAQSVIESQTDAIKMSISQMGMKLEYDSEHPEKTSPMLAGQTKEMDESLNKPINITYDALGNIADEDTDLAKNQLGNAIIQLPEEELKVGSKWSSKKTQEVSGTEIIASLEYTVTAISKKSVDVSFTGNVESKDVTGSYNGTASINPQTGMIMSSSTKTNFNMTINEQGMSLPLNMIGTTTVEVK